MAANPTPSPINEWVKLNIGGTVFSTTRSTLSREKNSFLSRLCQDDPDLPSLKDDSGAYLVDRDPRYFYSILNFLRHGKLIIEPSLTVEGILEEAEFYNLPSLARLAQDRLTRRTSEIDADQQQVYRVLHCQEGEITQMLGTLSDGWKLAQLVNIGSQYSYSSEDQSEFLVVVSRIFDDLPKQRNKPTNKEKVFTEHGLRM